MPQSTPELRREWDENSAWVQLATKVLCTREGVIHPCDGSELYDKDYRAIDYLCQEFDYGFNKRPLMVIQPSLRSAATPKPLSE